MHKERADIDISDRNVPSPGSCLNIKYTLIIFLLEKHS